MSKPAPTTTTPAAIPVEDWGRTAYAEAVVRQQEQVRRRIDGEAPDTLIFTEHDPVYTIGSRTGASAHLLWDAAKMATRGISVEKTNRGGDITYHGPGQVVAYPIVNLSSVRDLHAYLWFLEEVMIRAVSAFGLAATRREGLTGIWLGARKLAAVGVAVRRWITHHGFALNVDPNLDHFDGIIPCGIQPDKGAVTSLERELPQPPSGAEVKAVLAREFGALWPRFINPREHRQLRHNATAQN
jgi:lipoyl(octanoyl) transferase